MAYKVTEACTNCGACESACGNQAISKGEDVFIIDPERCTECVGNFPSPKCVEVCMLDACVPDPEHKETKEQLLEKWHRLHPGEEPAPDTY
jgi:ferredoxin